jgi:hypothetical protein
MNFSAQVLLEIMNIVQKGLLEQEDISQNLRELELIPDPLDPTKLILAPKVQN